MGSRLFVAASTQRITSASSGWASNGGAHTVAALVTVASLPGAAVYRTAFSFSSATAARELSIELNGDSSGTVGAKVGATRMVPSTTIVPPTAGEWLLIGASKQSGTVTVQFFMYNFATGTWSESSSSGTVGNVTPAAVSGNMGSRGAADYWDGRIAAAAKWNRYMDAGEYKHLIEGRKAWWASLQKLGHSTFIVAERDCYIDLTRRTAPIRDEAGDKTTRGILWTTGTQPAFDAVSTPPGW